MLTRVWAGLVTAALLFSGNTALSGVPYKIVTASERSTYIQIGRDLARFVAPGADIDLEVLPSNGPVENVNRLRLEPAVKFAIVQSDLFPAFLDASVRNSEAGRIIRPLRVITPLYNEEIYFIVRADSPLQYVHEIRDKRMNVGPPQSSSAISAATVYRLMFGRPIAESNTSFASNEEGLIKLTIDQSLDVVAVVAAQPAKLLADMKPEAKQYIKLLKLDQNNPASKAALQAYFPATIRSASYPQLLDHDVPGLAVKALLVTYDDALSQTTDDLTRFAWSLCLNFPVLQNQGHPKWREVELDLPELGQGWLYHQPVYRALRACMGPKPSPKPVTTCSEHGEILCQGEQPRSLGRESRRWAKAPGLPWRMATRFAPWTLRFIVYTG